MRTSTNNAWDFLTFILEQINDGRLVEGDTLICDNASIHNAQDTLNIINEIFTARGMRLIFLPKYSPELNPCELIWSQMKRYIRSHLHNMHSLLHTILLACTHVSWHDVYGYYTHSLYNCNVNLNLIICWKIPGIVIRTPFIIILFRNLSPFFFSFKMVRTTCLSREFLNSARKNLYSWSS
jgi:transposase